MVRRACGRSLPLGINLDQAHRCPRPHQVQNRGANLVPPEGQVLRPDHRHRALMDLPNVTLLTGRKWGGWRPLRRQDCDRGGLPDGAGRALDATSWRGRPGRAQFVRRAAGVANAGPSERPGPTASDQVGRHYMFHTLTPCSPVPAPTWTSPSPRPLACNDFYCGDPDGSYDQPMGHNRSWNTCPPYAGGQVGDWLPPGLVPDVLLRGQRRSDALDAV